MKTNYPETERLLWDHRLGMLNAINKWILGIEETSRKCSQVLYDEFKWNNHIHFFFLCIRGPLFGK